MSSPPKEIRLGRKLRGQVDAESYGLEHQSGEPKTVIIPVGSLNRHACIFGRTGGGKSITAKVIASEILSAGGVAVLILDRTGEFARSGLASQPVAEVLAPGLNLTISPFARRSDGTDEDLEQAVSLMHHFIESTFRGAQFTSFQERAFRDALAACYTRDSPRLSDLLSQLDDQGEKARNRYKGWTEGNQAVISRLTPLSRGTLARVFDSDGPELSPPDLFSPGLHIVNLGALDTDEARNMLSQVLCKVVSCQGKKLGETKHLRFVLMVDEAQHIAPSRKDYEGILEKYANELRK